MSLLDIVEEKYGTPVRGSKSSKSTQSPLADLKLLKEPRPKRSELREGAGNDQADAPSGKLATATTHRLEWSDGTLVQSVDQWSKRLQETDDDELRCEAGEDWDEVSNDPAQLVAFADSLAIVHIRESGGIPDTYVSATTCQNCGEVPIWLGCPPKVTRCPWCMNGQPPPPFPDSQTDRK